MRLLGEDGSVVCETCIVADTALTRMRGLLGRTELPSGEGMLIRPANSIHTWFMRFTIDALFLDKQGNVVKIASRMKPWKLTSIAIKARGVLELPEGTIEKSGTRVGDLVEKA